jgi:hypothetical protein
MGGLIGYSMEERFTVANLMLNITVMSGRLKAIPDPIEQLVIFGKQPVFAAAQIDSPASRLAEPSAVFPERIGQTGVIDVYGFFVLIHNINQ